MSSTQLRGRAVAVGGLVTVVKSRVSVVVLIGIFTLSSGGLLAKNRLVISDPAERKALVAYRAGLKKSGRLDRMAAKKYGYTSLHHSCSSSRRSTQLAESAAERARQRFQEEGINNSYNQDYPRRGHFSGNIYSKDDLDKQETFKQ